MSTEERTDRAGEPGQPSARQGQRSVLIIEDEQPLRRSLSAMLCVNRYVVQEAATAQQGLEFLGQQPFDIVLLDLGLPDLDGVELTQRVRLWTQVPIIVLSGREHEADKIRALDAGADDYLTKPFAVGELLARMRVALRHSSPRLAEPAEPVVAVGELRVDLAHRQVFRDGVEVRLTPREYRLLLALLQRAGQVATHKQLLSEVWGPEFVEHVHYLRVYMAQLRQKLEKDPNRPRLLRTEPGVGYRLKSD
ncbi:MAG: response regulator [Polyangia bacterium]